MLILTVCNLVQAADKLEIISLSPASPTVLEAEQRIMIKVKYQVDSAEWSRIIVRPYTKGKRPRDYGAHPSPQFEGKGDTAGWFTFSDEAKVDEIRVEMRSPENKLLAQASLSVDLAWKGGDGSAVEIQELKKVAVSECIITNMKYTPASPAKLKFGDRLQVTYDYKVKGGDGVRIQSRPYFDGKVNVAYGCNPSGILKGNGTGKAFFTNRDDSKGKPQIDEFNLIVKSADWRTPVDEISVKVDFRFSDNGDSN